MCRRGPRATIPRVDRILLYSVLIWTLAAGAGLVGAGLLIWRLHGAPQPFAGLLLRRELGLALLASGLACVPLLIVGTVGRIFGCIHAIYAGLTLTMPLLGLALVFAVLPRAAPRTRVLLAVPTILALLPAVAGLYASKIEPTWLEIVAVDVPVANRPANSRPIRIVVLADLQFRTVTPYERGVIETALGQGADLILLPGDFVQADDAHFEAHRESYLELLRPLRDHPHVYAVLGNIDPPERTIRLLHEADLRLLNDDVIRITIGDVRIALGGVDYWRQRARPSPVYRDLAATSADVRILMSHVPDGVFAARPEHAIDLIIAGHTHGGQVALPGFGPFLTFSAVPRAVAGGGLHAVNGQPIYVSRGLGVERGAAPPLRLFCRPELTVLTLRGTAPPASID